MTEVETLVSSSLEVLSRNVSSYFWTTSPTPLNIPPPPPLSHLHHHQQRLPYRYRPTRGLRRIRFADEYGEPLEHVSYCVPSRKKLTLVDRNRLWLDAAELQNSKLQIGDVCRKLRDQGLSELLTDTVRGGAKTQMKLDRWVIQGAPLRGLERHVNRQHGQERDQLRTQAVKAVLEAQRRMRLTGDEPSAEFLAKVSFALSQASRELALKLAAADERAMALALQEDRRKYLQFSKRGHI